jgi:hypothetical protein
MKKALIIVVLCALFAGSVLAQTCGPIEVGPKVPVAQEFYVGDSARLYFNVDSGGTAPYTFHLIDAPPGAIIGATNGWYRHYIEVNQSYTINVGVTDANGCTGSLVAWVTVMCNPISVHFVDRTAAQGDFWSRPTPISPVVKAPYSNFEAYDLPPGLSVSSTGVISGTPTQQGTYQTRVSYTGLGGCWGSTYINFTIDNSSCSGFYFLPQFELSDTSFVDLRENLSFRLATTTRAVYTVLSMPPGFTFSGLSIGSLGGYFSGEVQNPGTYEFSVRAENAQYGCVNTFTFQRTYIVSPTHICDPIEIAPAGEYPHAYVGETVEIDFNVASGGEDPPFTFSGVNMPAGATLDPATGEYSHFVTTNQSYEFQVVVTDSFGCTGTLTSGATISCNPVNMYYATLPAGTRGQYYQQNVPPSTALSPPYSNFVAVDPLPAGLTLSSAGVLSGTPTVSGTFSQFQIRATGLGGCTASTYLTMTVKSNVALQSPWISALCAQSPDERNWVLHNPNSIGIPIEWRTMYATIITGSFTAVPGDNFFTTPDAGWPNSIRVTWFDGSTPVGTIVQGANDNLCNPPACVEVSGITFFNQGRQKNLNPIPAVASNPNAVKGPPDALDAPGTDSKSFSLGFYGFITVKLSADLYDQPGPDLKVWENTENDPLYAAYPERAEVFVSTDNSNWISLGYTNPTGSCQEKLDWEFDLAGKAAWCRYVKVLDRTNEWSTVRIPSTCLPGQGPIQYAFGGTANGFDLDAITCVTPASGPPPNARMAADISNSDFPSISDELSDRYSVLSPNPATSMVTFDLSREPAFANATGVQVEISIVDMSGRRIQGRMHVLDAGLTTSENVEELSSGFFVAQVRAKGFAKYYKFMKR